MPHINDDKREAAHGAIVTTMNKIIDLMITVEDDTGLITRAVSIWNLKKFRCVASRYLRETMKEVEVDMQAYLERIVLRDIGIPKETIYHQQMMAMIVVAIAKASDRAIEGERRDEKYDG